MFILKPIKIKKIELSPLVFILFAVAFCFEFSDKLILTYIFALLHELAHVSTAYFCNAKISKIQILPFGVNMTISPSEIKSTKNEIIIAGAGPIFSLLAGILFLFTKNSYLCAVNLSIAVINIIPAVPLDGGRILKAYLTDKYGHRKAFFIMMTVTKILSFVLFVSGAVILVLTGFNFSVMLIGAFLIVNCLFEQRSRRITIMDEILKSHKKLQSEKMMRTEYITIKEDEPVFLALKMFCRDKYYFLNIVDENSNLIATISETSLINSLITKGIRIKASETVDFKSG